MAENAEHRTSNVEHPRRHGHLLAFVCAVCPFCIVARMFPKSRYAQIMRGVERACPACKAYAEIRGKTSAIEG